MKKLKVMTVVGTRPEIIRLSRVMAKLDRHCDHVLVHTGQNYDYELNQVFFDDLDIARVRLLCDLRKDMAISGDTIPVILSLIDRLHKSQREFRMLQQALDEQPEDMRLAVLNCYESIRKP